MSLHSVPHFKLQDSALLYLVNNCPNRRTRTISSVPWNNRTIIRIARATHGRMLGIFHVLLHLLKQHPRYCRFSGDGSITVYEQGEGASANTLLEIFRENRTRPCCLVARLWEGVDIPGEALSVLVIVKLPFIPSDPIIAARSRLSKTLSMNTAFRRLFYVFARVAAF